MKKWKMFKSELRTYVVKIEIFENYTHQKHRIEIQLFNNLNNDVIVFQETDFIDENYTTCDLDKIARNSIRRFENWKNI